MKTFIQLDSLRFYAYHGVGEQERRVGNEYVVSLRLAVDLRRAMQTDDVADTLDYAALCAAAQRLAAARPWRLLESYAGALLDLIFTDARVQSASVHVEKQGLLPDARAVGVILRRHRDPAPAAASAPAPAR